MKKRDVIHISFSNTQFNCPYCNKEYNDIDDVYLDKCNKNKNGITRIKCQCSKKFGMTYDIKCNAVSFEL